MTEIRYTVTEDAPRIAAAPAAADEKPAACPFVRHHTFDGQTSIMFGYADLTAIMERILDIWDHLEDHGHMTNEAGDLFESLLGHLHQTREWTGWDGVPGKYLL
jgi:hypothetical protein